ncbi:MAG: GNAT family N-acetyltransferase [Marinosulfonomonas sp.]|nr:GNAT family N-acetyltransferase [Marinosulfonomonas sp.]
MNVDPSDLAVLHARCFKTPRPWNTGEFTQLLADKNTVFTGDNRAFVLGRLVLDQVELLTIAVSPAHRRIGLGKKRLSEFEKLAQQRGGVVCFLEVAENNRAAIALYSGHGYTESGRRPGYYREKNAIATDAILLSKPLFAP